MAVGAGEDLELVDFRSSLFPSRLGILAGGLVAAAALVLLAFYASGPGHTPRASAAGYTIAAPPPRLDESPIPPPPPLASGATEEEKVSPPKTTGTVIGSPQHRLYVDGRLAATWKVEMTCGKHLVKNGAGGVARTVDVPCGGNVEVDP